MASVYRRGEVYYAKFQRRGQRQRLSLNTTSKRVAHERLRQLLSRSERGEDVLQTKTPVSVAVAEFLQHLRAHHREENVNREAYRLREFFGPVCPELQEKRRHRVGVGRPKPTGRAARPFAFAVRIKYLEDVSTGMISSFIARKVTEQGLKPKTANEYREIIQRLFNWAIDEQGVRMPGEPRANPASDVKRYRVPAPEIQFLRLKDIWEQLRALEDHPQFQTIVAVYIFAGLRREEGLWLTDADIDLPRRLIHVRAKTINGVFWQPKTGENRVVPVSHTLLPYLSGYVSPGGTPWYFPSPMGLSWNPDNFSNTLRRINRKAGLSWTCSLYRHTFGSHLAMKGETMYKISAMMGNSPEICRKHYARLLDESLVESVEFVDCDPVIQLRPAAAG